MVALSASSLYETKVLGFVCFPIIVVYIDDQNKQVDYLMKNHDEMTREQAMGKIKSQMDIQKKVDKADISINNSRTLE